MSQVTILWIDMSSRWIHTKWIFRKKHSWKIFNIKKYNSATWFDTPIVQIGQIGQSGSFKWLIQICLHCIQRANLIRVQQRSQHRSSGSVTGPFSAVNVLNHQSAFSRHHVCLVEALINWTKKWILQTNRPTYCLTPHVVVVSHWEAHRVPLLPHHWGKYSPFSLTLYFSSLILSDSLVAKFWALKLTFYPVAIKTLPSKPQFDELQWTYLELKINVTLESSSKWTQMANIIGVCLAFGHGKE